MTGTDTGVGKTLVSCALLRAAAARGLRAVGMKPVAAGAQRAGDAWINEDVTALREAGNVSAPSSEINPYCFAPPIAPHLAAAEGGVMIDLDVVALAYAALTWRADVVIVEGAGGYLVPLGPALDMADLARCLRLPVLLVVGMRLGCINHALLTAQAIRARGSALAGWVANHIDPHMDRADANVDALTSRLDAPLIGRVPYGADPHVIAAALDVGTLLAGPPEVR
ncbi:MAG TPA: dethiobiotin synthase [Burkholderiales bacterium]|nr:dethiobiotin synthase [Burkholderiales bacterium]